MCGNVKEFSDTAGSLGERCLFLLTAFSLKSDCLEVGWNGGQITLSSEVFGVLLTGPEKLKERYTCTPGRTHNCIRHPRLAASGPWNSGRKGKSAI